MKKKDNQQHKGTPEGVLLFIKYLTGPIYFMHTLQFSVHYSTVFNRPGVAGAVL